MGGGDDGGVGILVRSPLPSPSGAFTAPVGPLGGGGLRVQVDNGDAVAGLGGGDGNVDGDGGLAHPALLRNDSQGFHV